MIQHRRKDDFYVVSLLVRKPFHYKFWLCFLASVLVTVILCKLADIAVTIRLHNISIGIFLKYGLLVLLVYLLFQIWKWYRKYGRCRYPFPSAERLRYFLEANKLFETGYKEKQDGNGRIVKEKIYSNSAFLGCWEDNNNERIIIRAYKRGDAFTDKMNDLDTGLSALFKLDIDNKIDTISYCDYIFKKMHDKRIIIKSKNEIEYNNGVTIPLNNNLSWNILKQPHMLLAGVTGSGKTTFLNYLIMEMMKMKSEIYICDPKRSDLSSLQHYIGKEFVASETNMIAKMSRIVKEIMNNRFIDYKENADIFVYGYSFVDYKLKPVFLIFDELGAFRAGADKKVFTETMENLTEIILKGREMGVFCILSTQQPNANNIPTELRDNLSVRLAMGNMSNEGYRMVFGESDDLQSINITGGGYIYLDGLGWAKPKCFESPYLDYKQFNFIEEITKYK